MDRDAVFRAQIENLNAVVAALKAKGPNRTTTVRRKTKTKTVRRKTKTGAAGNPNDNLNYFPEDRVPYFLFECAFGYALFGADRVIQLDKFTFEAHDDYITCPDNFKLIAFHRFSSISDAHYQMTSISNSIMTPDLKSFLMHNIPTRRRTDGISHCYVATDDPILGHNIVIGTQTFAIQSAIWIRNLMRGLRMNIHNFIGCELKDLEKEQMVLARLYNMQRRASMGSSSSLQQLVVGPHRGRHSSSSFKQFVVVPHRFEGVFVTKGEKKNLICTKNLVPGEALSGEELIYGQNEDGTEVEHYRLWNPRKSKLAAAITCGVQNIWAEPGSRVLYLGEVCEVTVAHLSDLVGMDGLVYVVGTTNDLNMAGKWLNVISILENPCFFMRHRMIVGMVDVLIVDIVDIVHAQEVDYIATNASYYLRAGGHYMVSTQADNIYSINHLFAGYSGEFTPIENVILEPIVRGHVMMIGGFRVQEE